jgi:dihydroneopterin aldolase
MTISRRRIFFRDLELQVSIGIHDFEQNGPQRVVINIDLELDGGDAEIGDDIANVLDYDRVRERIATLIDGRHFNLQETLCHDIVASLSDLPGVDRIRVSTEKPDVYPDCDAVGYELFADLTG